MEIKIKTERKVEETHIVKLPYYSKSYAHYFKVISTMEVLKIYDGGNNFGIELHTYGADMAFNNTELCTEEEFMTAFILIQGKLNAKLI